MDKRKKKRADYNTCGYGYYHLCTDGWKDGRLFNSVAQFIYGVITIGLICIKYHVKVYCYCLMSNHVHIILSGFGRDCVQAFDYLKRRISMRLRKDGNTPLPADYDFVLIPIADEEQMRANVLYILRNPYEKLYCTPAGYIWGTGWLFFSQFPEMIHGTRAKDFSKRKLIRMTGFDGPVPNDWEFHPDLGLLPKCVVETSLVTRLFSSVKGFETRLIKDYETMIGVAGKLNEELDFTEEEIQDIVLQVSREQYGNRTVKELTKEEKYTLAIPLYIRFKMVPRIISQALFIPEKIVWQVLRSKDFGNRDSRHLGPVSPAKSAIIVGDAVPGVPPHLQIRSKTLVTRD